MPRIPKQLSFTDHRMRTGRGGPRPGSGRPRGPRPRVLHRERGAVPVQCPVHVTLRVRPDVPSLRGGALVREWRRSLAEAYRRRTPPIFVNIRMSRSARAVGFRDPVRVNDSETPVRRV